jgi:hypothetical protein
MIRKSEYRFSEKIMHKQEDCDAKRFGPKRSGARVIAALASLLATSVHAVELPMDTAVLRALDKVTARVQTLRVPVGLPVTFGRLEILVKSCHARPPEETPESSALLEIHKIRGKERDKKDKVFDGWMFASSPDLSAMDDPVYDLWVLSCENKASANAP